MKRTFTTICAVCAAIVVMAQQSKPAIPRDAAIEAKVEKTLSKMTLEEKVGQMLQLTLDVLGKKDGNGVWQLSENTLDTCISK